MRVMEPAAPPPRIGLPLSPQTRRDGRSTPSRAQRLAFASLLALFAAAAVAIAANFVWPWSISEDRPFYAGRSEQFPPGTVTSFAAVHGSAARPGFHVVRLDDGELLALLDEGSLYRLCRAVPSRFRLRGPRGLVPRPCRGWIFDMTGRHAFGPSPGLDRLAVEVRDGGVFVDPAAITRAALQLPVRYELQTGGALLTPALARPRYE